MERNQQPKFSAEPLDRERLLEHHAWLQGLAEDLVRDASHADDVVQETFLAALTCRTGGPRQLGPWLKTVLRNCVRQSHLVRGRRLRREEKVARPECVVSAAERSFEQKELQAHLERQVARLREPYRSTVVLHYFRELTLEEIARRQGLASATVRTRLRRALEELRTRMRSREPGLWAGALLGALRPRDATAAVKSTSVHTTARCASAHLGSSLSIGGIMQLGIKSISLASVVSVGLFGTVSGLYLLNRESGEVDRSLEVLDPVSARTSHPSSTGAAPRTSSAAERRRAATIVTATAELRGGQPAPTATSIEPSSPVVNRTGDDTSGETVSEAVLALRRDYSKLQRLFNSSGRGWKLVGDDIAKIREVIVRSDEGFDEFLALIDGEKDGPFLEAILHHLPLRSSSPFQKEIVEDEELHEELWARFEDEPDPYRRRSFLRFFCYHPKLSARKMAEFSDIVRHDESPLVRGIGMDAIGSANFPKDVWPALCDVAEQDTDETLRAWAIRGLARADSERAGDIYRAAFSSESEAIRAAAVSAHTSEAPPPEAVGGGYTSYLVGEFRVATTKEYRQALIDRLLGVAPITLLDEARRALRNETDRQVKQQYRKAVALARVRVERRDE